MMETMGSPNVQGLRVAVLVIAVIESVLFVVFEVIFLGLASSPDPFSRGIAGAAASAIAVSFALFTLPALILGVMGRWLKFALAFAIIAVPATVVTYALV